MVAGKRAAVVHPNDHRTAVLKVGDFHVGGQRKMLVRRRQRVRIERLTVGGHMAVLLIQGFVAVPGGDAGLFVPSGLGDRHGIILFTFHRIRGILDAAQADGFLDRQAVDGLDILVHQRPCDRRLHHVERKLADVIGQLRGPEGDVVSPLHRGRNHLVGSFHDGTTRKHQAPEHPNRCGHPTPVHEKSSWSPVGDSL